MLKTKYLFTLAGIVLLLSGCEKQYLADDGYVPENAVIEAKENRTVHFFNTSDTLNLAGDSIEQINKLLKETKTRGIDNLGVMFVSNKPISLDALQKARKQIKSIIRKQGFIDSRIVDSGACVYKDAKPGIRIDVLKYEVTEPDCSPWSEYVGDIDTNKNLPKKGVSGIYNLEEMIANKADLIAPRKYKGPSAKDSIAALGESASGSGGGSSSSSSSSSSGSSTSGKS